MTESEAKLLVKETLITLGIDVQKPVELQKDMAYLRSLRIGSDEIKKHSVWFLTAAALTAIIGWATLGFKITFGH